MNWAGVRDRLIGRAELHASYVRVFSTPDGERILRHILKQGGASKSSFVEGDPHKTSFNEGKRALALGIARFANLDHNKVLEMVERGLQDDS